MKKKQNNISIFDKITLCYLIFVKNFYYQYDGNLRTYYAKKICKIKQKRDKHHLRLFDKYSKASFKYDKYIAYLKYKELKHK